MNRELANRARALEAQKLLLAYEAARNQRTLKDTAIALQVDRKTISRLREGSHSPNRKLWEALAEAYDKHYPSGFPAHIHAWLQKWRALRYFGEEKYELAMFIAAVDPALRFELPLLAKTGRTFEAACAAFTLATLSASKGFDCIDDERQYAKLESENGDFNTDAENYLEQAQQFIDAHLHDSQKTHPAALRLRWKIMVNRDVLAFRLQRPRPHLEGILRAGEALLEFEPYNWEVTWNCFNYASTLRQGEALVRLWPLLLERMPDLLRPDYRVPGDSYKRWTDDPNFAFAIAHLALERQFVRPSVDAA